MKMVWDESETFRCKFINEQPTQWIFISQGHLQMFYLFVFLLYSSGLKRDEFREL